jgi:hypothetical protein
MVYVQNIHLLFIIKKIRIYHNEWKYVDESECDMIQSFMKEYFDAYFKQIQEKFINTVYAIVYPDDIFRISDNTITIDSRRKLNRGKRIEHWSIDQLMRIMYHFQTCGYQTIKNFSIDKKISCNEMINQILEKSNIWDRKSLLNKTHSELEFYLSYLLTMRPKKIELIHEIKNILETKNCVIYV